MAKIDLLRTISQMLKDESRKERKALIFLAGPFSGNVNQNIANVLSRADSLVEAGFVPYIPHLCHYWDEITNRERVFWLDYHKQFILRSDGLWVSGSSPGTDDEKGFAEQIGLP